MTNKDFKKVIKYLIHSCPNLTNKQVSKLYGLQFVAVFSLRDIRSVYRIAVDNGVTPVCPWCNMPIIDVGSLTIDHIYPKSLGGTDDIQNLQPMHKKCNEEKGASLPTENQTFAAPIQSEIRKHTRSEKEKYRCRNRQKVVKSNTVEDLEQKCKEIDNIRKQLYRLNNCKKR